MRGQGCGCTVSAVVGKSGLLLGLCVAVVVFLVVSACGAAEPGPPAGSTPVPGEAAVAGVEDASRPEAAILSGLTLDGEPISTEDFLGTPFVVKVFAEH